MPVASMSIKTNLSLGCSPSERPFLGLEVGDSGSRTCKAADVIGSVSGVSSEKIY